MIFDRKILETVKSAYATGGIIIVAAGSPFAECAINAEIKVIPNPAYMTDSMNKDHLHNTRKSVG